jgi:hypothetical protein
LASPRLQSSKCKQSCPAFWLHLREQPTRGIAEFQALDRGLRPKRSGRSTVASIRPSAPCCARRASHGTRLSGASSSLHLCPEQPWQISLSLRNRGPATALITVTVYRNGTSGQRLAVSSPENAQLFTARIETRHLWLSKPVSHSSKRLKPFLVAHPCRAGGRVLATWIPYSAKHRCFHFRTDWLSIVAAINRMPILSRHATSSRQKIDEGSSDGNRLILPGAHTVTTEIASSRCQTPASPWRTTLAGDPLRRAQCC